MVETPKLETMSEPLRPHVPPQEELDAQAKAASAKESKRSRPADSPAGSTTGSPSAPNKKSMNALGKAVSKSVRDAMDVTKPAVPQIDFANMKVHPKPILCAIKVHHAHSVLGSLTPFGATPGMMIKLRLDPGKLAMPSVQLEFRFSKSVVPRKEDKDFNSFNVSWEPGVKIAGEYMMQDLNFYRVDDVSMKDVVDLPEIQNLIRSPEEKARLICACFRSNAHELDFYDPEWPLNLQKPAAENVSAQLNKMMEGKGSHMMRIWFILPYEYFREACLTPLEYATKHHLQPNYVYVNEDGDPRISYDMPTMEAVGDGMYARYPQIPGDNGRKVPDTSVAPSYVKMPKKYTWDSLKRFQIYYGVSNVREHQYTIGLHANLPRDWHHVYLEKMPVWSVDGKEFSPDKPLFENSFFAGVRMTRDKNGSKSDVPPVGSIIKIDFFNGQADIKEHQGAENDIFYGRVEERSKVWLDASGTDFCALVTRRRHAQEQKSWPHDKLGFRPNDELPRARIEVRIDSTAGERELNALAKFCNKDYQPELLDQIRLAIVSDPSRAEPAEHGDLTWGPKHDRSQENHDKWNAIMNEHAIKRSDNRSQMDVLRSASKMRSNIIAVSGPPGTGKTKTLSDKCIALLNIKHKILCVAGANVAVDTDATAIWKGLTTEEQRKYKCLRLETGGAETAAILSKVNYAAYTNKEGEADKLPEYVDEKTAQDSPLMRNALEKLASDYATRRDQMKELMAEYHTVDKVYQALQRDRRLKRSNVPVGMTLDYRIWELTEADQVEAARQYEEARTNLGSEEFERRLAAGTISLRMFDRSAAYRALVARYIQKNGHLSKEDRLQFQNASDDMVTRVLADTSILFTTCINAGGKLLEDGHSFKPTVIFCDEAGQVNVASLCVPLTTFHDWEGLYLFGDIRQLRPTVLSVTRNEFIENAQISPLALLTSKGFPPLFLDTQYRMSPAISNFPNHQFYDGMLKNHPKAGLDDANGTRQKLRQLSRRAGVKGPYNTGSEYFLLDVRYGVSRPEVNGTSLVNHANADRIIALLKDMLASAIEPGEINILSYYQGQRKLLRQKISETIWPQSVKDALQVHTVDSYQGKESSVIIVDMVCARDPLMFNAMKSNRPVQEQPDDDKDDESESYVKFGAVTRHIKNGNRLNVALTRAMNGLVVVCQESLLVRGIQTTKSRGKQHNAIASMCGNARARNCYLMDDRTEDSHPQSVESRGNYSKEAIKSTRQEHSLSLGFIQDLKKVTGDLRRQKADFSVKVPKYRTVNGRTTRPIEESSAVVAADEHDEMMQARR